MTAGDYEAIVRQIYPATSDIIIFGGEDQDPPEYGKVFIALKPKDASYLSSLTKAEIVEALEKYTVASVEPRIIDPSILFVELNSKIYYDRNKTDDTPAQIRDKVITAVQSYLDTSDTEKFNGKFRYSKAIAVIDDADRAINSNLTSVTMRKDFYPQLNSHSIMKYVSKMRSTLTATILFFRLLGLGLLNTLILTFIWRTRKVKSSYID